MFANLPGWNLKQHPCLEDKDKRYPDTVPGLKSPPPYLFQCCPRTAHAQSKYRRSNCNQVWKEHEAHNPNVNASCHQWDSSRKQRKSVKQDSFVRQHSQGVFREKCLFGDADPSKKKLKKGILDLNLEAGPRLIRNQLRTSLRGQKNGSQLLRRNLIHSLKKIFPQLKWPQIQTATALSAQLCWILWSMEGEYVGQ